MKKRWLVIILALAFCFMFGLTAFADGETVIMYPDYDYTNSAPSFVQPILISLAIGLIIALIVVLVMKSKLKSVARQNSARFYVVNNSLHLTEAYERYLYNQIHRTPRPKPQENINHNQPGRF